MKRFNVGKYKHPITIQSGTEVLDEYNTPTVSWQDYFKAKAAIKTQRGREVVVAENIVRQDTVVFEIRYPKGKNVTPGMRLKYNDRYFDIQLTNDIEERHQEMQITCLEGDIHGTRI